MTRLRDRISIDPQVCGGRPCIRGTRIWVSLILDNLAAGMTEAELLAQYPQLVREDIRAAQAHESEGKAPGTYEWLRRRRDSRPGTDITSAEVLRGLYEGKDG